MFCCDVRTLIGINKYDRMWTWFRAHMAAGAFEPSIRIWILWIFHSGFVWGKSSMYYSSSGMDEILRNHIHVL